jgi:hypothetical protein
MNLELLLSDISEIKEEDFTYKSAYSCRKTNKHLPLYGKPLSVVLPIAKVCISGYLLSKYGFNCTRGIEEKFGLSDRQLECIIYPKSIITFDNDEVIKTPKISANLSTVIQHIKNLTENEFWLKDEGFEFENNFN